MGSLAVAAIHAILHDELSKSRFKNSKHAVADQERKTGAVFLVHTKEQLSRAAGVVATSEEAILDHIGGSHWTPNVFRYGTYSDSSRRTLSGHSEDNLKAINCFVVDADWAAGKKPQAGTPQMLDGFDFRVQLSERSCLMPSLLLDTPRGYQAYYILDQPVWIRRHENGSMPALSAAKKISQALRSELAKRIPQVDTGCNDFGFFRMPSDHNVLEFYPGSTVRFSDLLKWSKDNTKEQGAPTRAAVKRDQVHTKWFRALTDADVCDAEHSGYGRNNTLLTLCLAQYSSGVELNDAWNYADEWNSNLTSPLPTREVRAILRSAYSGKYQGAAVSYVDELLSVYAPETKRERASRHAWVKFAKPREQRKYSHLHEWAKDLLILVNQQTSLVKGHAVFSTGGLCAELGIKPSSLNRLLDLLQKQGAVSLKRQRGRNGGIRIATAQMIAHYVTELRQSARTTPVFGLSDPDLVAASDVTKMVMNQVQSTHAKAPPNASGRAG